jgi:hypothetical protein
VHGASLAWRQGFELLRLRTIRPGGAVFHSASPPLGPFGLFQLLYRPVTVLFTPFSQPWQGILVLRMARAVEITPN